MIYRGYRLEQQGTARYWAVRFPESDTILTLQPSQPHAERWIDQQIYKLTGHHRRFIGLWEGKTREHDEI